MLTNNGQDGNPGRGFHAGKMKVLGVVVCAAALVGGPATAQAGSGGVGIGGNGGHHHGGGNKTVAGPKAKLRHGRAIAPRSAPAKVKRAIRAANQIAGKPYKYGGGHASWRDSGYDCSGAVSYALGRPGARVLRAPEPSGSFSSFGRAGKGRWITTYSNSGHMYVMIAGLRFESHTEGDGPGWSNEKATNAGYIKRHPKGL